MAVKNDGGPRAVQVGTDLLRRPEVVLTDPTGAGTALTDIGAKADPVATSDTGTFSLIALIKRLVAKFFTQGAAAAAVYRSAVVAADVVAVPGTVTCTKLSAVGSATAGTYTVFVVAGNTYGRTTAKQGNTTVTTETTNLGIRAAFALVTGATFYDLYCSTDGAASKWVGRVTEAQRLSGIIIDAVGSTTAGGTANAVDIYVPGTGAAVNGGHLAFNSAYIPPASLAVPVTDIACTGYQYCDFDLVLSRTGDAVALAAILLPWFKDSDDAAYYGGTPFVPVFDGTAQVGRSLRQSYRVEVRGRTAVGFGVAALSGTGASVDVRYVLS